MSGSVYFGYNINGFAFHRLEDALLIIAEIGFGGVGITLDYHVLNPYDPGTGRECAAVRGRLERLGLDCVIETGARFLLDPRRKHQPTLISPDESERARRADFLIRAIEIAARLNAPVVSFWSGAATDAAPATVLADRFHASLEPVLRAAEQRQITLALEAEPGMAIDTLASAQAAVARCAHPHLALTVDVGHLHCQSEGDIPELIQEAGAQVRNVHIEDMRAGVHDPLMFGAGEIDFPPILQSLARIDYADGVHVELSRHSHNAVEAARQAFRFLEACRTTVAE